MFTCKYLHLSLNSRLIILYHHVYALFGLHIQSGLKLFNYNPKHFVCPSYRCLHILYTAHKIPKGLILSKCRNNKHK